MFRDGRPVLDFMMSDADDFVAFMEAVEYLHPAALPHTKSDLIRPY